MNKGRQLPTSMSGSCEKCAQPITGKSVSQLVLDDCAFGKGHVARYCSEDCAKYTNVDRNMDYSNCHGCKRYVVRWGEVRYRWSRLGVFAGVGEHESETRCPACFETAVLRNGHSTYCAIEKAQYQCVVLPDAVQAKSCIEAAGYVVLASQLTKFADRERIESICSDVRWDKWFMAFDDADKWFMAFDEATARTTNTLYVHPRNFSEQAVAAAVTFLLCAKHMPHRHGLLDVARFLIAAPVAKSGYDPVWARVYETWTSRHGGRSSTIN